MIGGGRYLEGVNLSVGVVGKSPRSPTVGTCGQVIAKTRLAPVSESVGECGCAAR